METPTFQNMNDFGISGKALGRLLGILGTSKMLLEASGVGLGGFCRVANIKGCANYVFENLPNGLKNHAFPEKSVF